MAVCPGGTRPKESTPGIIILAGALLESFLLKANPALAAFTSFMAPVTVDSRILCNGDPPPVPELVALDFINLAMGQVTQNIKDLVLRFAWFQFCECVDAPTPAPEVVPVPADMPVYVPGPALPCSSFHVQYRPTQNQPAPMLLYGSSTAPIGMVQGTSRWVAAAKVVARSTSVYTCGYYRFLIHWLSPTGNLLGTDTVPIGYAEEGNDDITITVFPASNSTRFYIEGECVQPAQACCNEGDVLSLDISVYCDDVANRSQPECCPPDPALAAKLDYLAQQINSILERLGEAGALQQLATTNIAGEGTVALQAGARQVNVQLSTLGSNTSFTTYAHPDRLMRAGTIRFGNAFGWRRREHVDNTDCLFVVPADSTTVSWSLSPGTTGVLVQLGTPLDAS